MKRILWLAGILVLILAVSIGCGTSGESATSRDTSSMTTPTITTTAATTTMTLSQSKYAEMPAAYQGDQAYEVDRMIIRTGSLSLVVEDVAGAMQQIMNYADVYGGYVVASNSWQDNERMMGNISIRVDADRFFEAMAVLRGLAVEVTSESTSGQDVTEEYVDLEARLITLEASQEQLLVLMEAAGTVEEILGVQQELTDTRKNIEQIKGRMQYLEQSSALSLISVNLAQSKLVVEFTAVTRTVKEGEDISFSPIVAGGFPPYTYEWDFGDGETSTEPYPSHRYGDDGTFTVTLKMTDDRGNEETYERADYIRIERGWNPGSIAAGAWNGLATFGRVLVNILIWLGIFSPVWIAIFVIIFLVRRRRKNVAQD